MYPEIEFFFNHELSGNTTEVLTLSRAKCRSGEFDGHKCDLVAACLWSNSAMTSLGIQRVFDIVYN